MRTRFVTLLIVILLILSAVTACGPKQQAEPAAAQPKATIQADPTATPVAEKEAADSEADDEQADAETQDDEQADVEAQDDEVDDEQEESLGASDLVDPLDLDSFRQTITWSSHDPEEGYLKGEMLMEWVRETQATRTVINMSVGEEQESLSEIIQIGDMTYMKVNEQWMSMQSAEEDTANDMLMGWSDPEGLIDECQSKGRDTIDGMATKHYYCDKDVFLRAGILGMGSAGTLEGITVDEGSYEVWVSTKHDIPVKTVWQWKGTHSDGDVYDWYFESAITDINGPITIEKPAEADEAGLPDDIPLMDGATEVGVFGDVVSFVAPVPQSEVIAYYEREMVANGWTKEDTPFPSMMSFSKDGRSATVVIGEKDLPAVTIMVGDQ